MSILTHLQLDSFRLKCNKYYICKFTSLTTIVKFNKF